MCCTQVLALLLDINKRLEKWMNKRWWWGRLYHMLMYYEHAVTLSHRQSAQRSLCQVNKPLHEICMQGTPPQPTPNTIPLPWGKTPKPFPAEEKRRGRGRGDNSVKCAFIFCLIPGWTRKCSTSMCSLAGIHYASPIWHLHITLYRVLTSIII